MTEDLDASTRLQHAIAALTSTTPHVLLRDGRDAREQLDAEHQATIRSYRARHAEAAARHDRAGMTRWINAMTIAGHRHRARRTALLPELATAPSLLEQLVDAVHSATGHGNGSRGVHRSPLNSAAVELLADIRRATSGPACSHANLGTALVCWAETRGDDRDQAANNAERWLAEARAVLEPKRRGEAKAACPICRTRWVWVRQDGEDIRRAAIQINWTDSTAHCIAPGCTGHWDRDHIDLLARVLEQDVDERSKAG